MPSKTLQSRLESLERKGISLDDIRLHSEESKQGVSSDDFSIVETVKNIPGSLANLAGDVFSAVSNPKQTIKGLGEFVVGGASELGRKLGTGINAGQPETQEEQTFGNVVDFFKERYGGIDNIKKTVQEDPAGFLADVAGVLTGGGAAIRGAGNVSRIQSVSKAGSAIQKAGVAAEPLSATFRGVGKVTRPVRRGAGRFAAESLGVSTGVGGEVIKEAFLNPTKEFRQALRGKVDEHNILTAAREGLGELKLSRGNRYRSQLKEIAGAKNQLDISGFRSSIRKKLKDFNITSDSDGVLDFTRSTIADNTEAARVSDVVDAVLKWEDTTPIGLDILKQRLDDFYSPSGKARSLTNGIRGDLKRILNKEVKGYAQMTKEYSEITSLINEIEKTLSLGRGARIDTSLTKLTSAMRNNKEYRRFLVESIDELSGSDITQQIAGRELSRVVPSGLVGRSLFAGAFGSAALGFLSPKLLLGLSVTSPRIVGEFLTALGLSRQAINSVLDFVTSPAGRKALQGAVQSGRVREQSSDE